MDTTPFYKRAEFWAATLAPLAVAVWPLVVLRAPWLAGITPDMIVTIIAGGIVAIITGAVGVTAGAHARMGNAARVEAARLTSGK